MTAKEYFKQGWNINKLIESDQRKIVEIEEQMSKLKSSVFSEKVQGSKNNANLLDALIDKKNAFIGKIFEEMNQLMDLQLQMIEVINRVPGNSYRLILRLRYIEFMKWEEISKQMNYTERRVEQLHGEALKKVKLPNSFR